MYKKVERCRICGNTNLVLVLDLGEQMLTGVFPRHKDAKATVGPLQLVKCVGDGDVCGLLQLAHSYDLAEMYGVNYGYRSGLNKSMVAHLHDKVRKITRRVSLAPGDLVVDIGSNDGTTLSVYPDDLTLVGIDPTGSKFRQYYSPHVELIPDFFSSALLTQRYPGRRARVITSFSMFYDLEDPVRFMREIHEALADDGIWVFEQSYMPEMLRQNSYDTVCHEHLEFYALHQIKWMTDRVGFDILDVEFNDVNGGSFSITVAKSKGQTRLLPEIRKILDDEEAALLDDLSTYSAFAQRVEQSKQDLLAFIKDAQSRNEVVAAIGASTKGNVLLQYCGLTEKEISFVGEVNGEKFGCYTPGTWIPIIPEDELVARKPDYVLVLPWHFRKFFESRKNLASIDRVYPLPVLSVSGD